MAERNKKKISPSGQPQLAYRSERFLESGDARTLRIVAEYLEPQARLRRAGVQNTVVFFGSARTHSREEAEKRLRDLETQRATNPASRAALKAARTGVQMSRYYEEARHLAKLVTEVAGAREFRGQGRRQVGETAEAVVAQAMLRRQQAGEDRGVRGQRERDRGTGFREPDTLGGQPVQVRRFRAVIAVHAKVIGAHRVQGHQQQVEPGGRYGTVHPRAARGEQQDGARGSSRNRQSLQPRSHTLWEDIWGRA